MDTTKDVDAAQLDADLPRIDVRRRVLLRTPGLLALGSLAAVSLGRSMPAWAQTQSGSVKDDINILNTALGLEYQAIAAYQVGAESGLLQKPVLATAVKFQGHHKAHAQVLSGTVSKLGGTPVMERRWRNTTSRSASSRRRPTCCALPPGWRRGPLRPIWACCRISIRGI